MVLLQIVVMKVVSLQLPSGPSMERLPLPFSPTELLWRYPLPWAPPPPSPLGDTKAQLPAGLPPEPRLWTREDVAVFLKWCEREFDLPNFDMDLFQMNGMQIVDVLLVFTNNRNAIRNCHTKFIDWSK